MSTLVIVMIGVVIMSAIPSPSHLLVLISNAGMINNATRITKFIVNAGASFFAFKMLFFMSLNLEFFGIAKALTKKYSSRINMSPNKMFAVFEFISGRGLKAT